MKDRTSLLVMLFHQELVLLLSVGFTVASFVLVFQPFPVAHFDREEQILFAFGMGAMLFLFLLLVRVVYPFVTDSYFQREHKSLFRTLAESAAFWLLNVVLMAGYTYWPGQVVLTHFVVLQIAVMGFIPLTFCLIHIKIVMLKREREALFLTGRIKQKDTEMEGLQALPEEVSLSSETGSEVHSLLVSEILFLHSADNYVEIHMSKDNVLRKLLLRNSLKNMEQQLMAYPQFIRCHRTCVVNTLRIEKANGNCNHFRLFMKGFDLEVPVSRQYFAKIRDAI